MLSVIIPIHNIARRGFLRVYYSCYSLLLQDELGEIIIVNSSTNNEFIQLANLLSNMPDKYQKKVKHLRLNQCTFNKPKLLNKGIAEASYEWIMCTDADYLFSKDFLKVCQRERSEKAILFKEVKMLPSITIKKPMIDRWEFPMCKYNEWGHLANGACQYATKGFFINNPYPEIMSGFGAMDNIMAYIAYNNGLELKWIEDGEILHQFHKVEKFQRGGQTKEFNRNQEVLANYIKKHNLPKLLTKSR